MNHRRAGGLRGGLTAVGIAALIAALPCGRALAQAAPEGDEYLKDDLGGGFIDQLATKARVGTMLRESYFSRTKPNQNGPSAQAGGIGGWLYAETGEYEKFLTFGSALAYVAPLSAPAGHGGNFVLKDPDQQGYSTVDEAYARLRYDENALYAGRLAPTFAWSLDGIYRFYNRFDGAFIGRRDIRGMIPLAYEGATVAGQLLNETVRYYGGWVDKAKQINDSSFKNLASAALLPGYSDGMAFGGAQWKIDNDVMLQGGYHKANNLLDIVWLDLDSVHRMGTDRYLRLDVQYIEQQPTGENNLGAFPTSNRAAYVEARWWPWLIPYAMIGRNGDGDELRSPFSLGPSYLAQRIGENAKAGEHTWIFGTTFDFATLSAPGLAFDANYGHRSDRHLKNDAAQPLANWDELATDLIYTLGKYAGVFEGIRVRARWARVWERGDQYSGGVITDLSQQTTDVRLDLQWKIAFR